MKKKTLWVYLGFFAVLLIGFYLALAQFMDFRKSRLPVLGYVKPFGFLNQEGKTITQKDIEGRVVVVEFFFTTCKGICPKMNANMKKLYDAFSGNPAFMILSHTVDPQTDSVSRLKRYADSMGVSASHWNFLTGSKEDLYRAARESYLLDDEKNNTSPIDEQFIHTQLFALVDKNGKLRGMIYDGLKTEEVEKLRKDIGELLEEPAEGTRFVNSLYQNNPQ